MRQFWNNTKVICTIGPSCAKKTVLRQMILAGMDIARFNFSHGKPSEHVAQIRKVKKMASDLGVPLAILQDLPGPKIRIGPLKDEFILLEKGQRFFLSSRAIVGTSEGVSVNHPAFVRQLKRNHVVYLNDGLVKLVVLSKAKDGVICSVISGGMIYPKKGVSCPGLLSKLSPVTAHDVKCLEYGIAAGVDFVAVSFVQRAADILKVKNYLKRKAGGKNISVIAKIERKIAVKDIDNIINVSDGIMVARGDLGVEAALEEVPFLQKEIIKKCNAHGRPVITATQMLESMVYNPQPTRAEVTDVANAILDGTDALMLSEETAVGKFPVKTVKMMISIASRCEEKLNSFLKSADSAVPEGENLIESFSRAAVDIARHTRAKAIIVPALNVHPISWLSRRRPMTPVVGITTKEDVCKKLILFWGVYPVTIKKFAGLQETLDRSVQLVKAKGLAKQKDNVVIMLTKDNRLVTSNIMEVRTIK